MRVIPALALTVAALLLGACGSHSTSNGSTPIGPTDPTIGNGAGPNPPPATFHPMFNVSQGVLPWPTDLYFAGSTDGSLNLPTALEPFVTVAALNGLDGFSTTAPMSVHFSAPIDSMSLNPADVVVIRIALSNTTKAPLAPTDPGFTPPVPLAFGTDYTAYIAGAGLPSSFAQALDSNGSTLVLEPTHPLEPSSGANNVGYLVLLTNGIKDTSGTAAIPDNDYATVQQGALADLLAGKQKPTCSTVTDPTLNLVCQLTFAHLAIAYAGGINPASVVLSFSFTTQATADTTAILAATYAATPVPPNSIVAVPIGKTTADLLAAKGVNSPGLADIWVGTVTLPYYLTAATNPHDTAPLTQYWTAAGPSPVPGIDPASRKLTRFNPVPAVTSQQTVPLIVGVPNANSHCTEPQAGWKAIVVQHGLRLDRSYAVAVMDAYASQCFVVAAIDMPLHGITDPTSPLYRNQLLTGTPAAGLIVGERTFDLDLYNNTTLAPGPDNQIDPSGTSWINLTSLLTARDNLRQSTADVLWFAHVLPTLSLGAHASDIDGMQLQFAAESTGGMIGIAALSMPQSPFHSAALSSAGGIIATLLRDSADFGPLINALLKAGSGGLAVPGSSGYDSFFRDAQTAIDAGDPINYVAAAVASTPILFQRVIGGGTLPDGTASAPDQVIPSHSSLALVTAANFTRFGTPGTLPLPAASGAYVNFLFGHHGNIFGPDPSTVTPNTLPSWLAVTQEMQSEVVGFAVAHGQAVTITNGSLVQP